MYRPERRGVPSYFPAMLDDADRNAKYEAAIRAAIADFARREGRPPVVVDLGCGTGMLTLFALRHGAAHVVSVDVNPDVAGMCDAVVERAREPGWGTQETVCETFVPGGGRPGWLAAAGYDMLVSEILGTTGSSESMHAYVGAALAHINAFDGEVYCVPRQLRVTARWYEARELAASAPGGNLPLVVALSGLQHWDAAPGGGAVTADFLHTKDGVFLHHMGCEPASAEVELLRETYRAKAPAQVRAKAAAEMTLPSVTPATVLVIEWTATLWRGVELRNTLDELRRMPPRNAAARACAWGHLYYRPFADDLGRAVAIEMRVAGWPRGVPKLRLKAVA